MQRVSVRRAKIEEQRARKMAIGATIGAVLLGGIFLIFIFPLLLRGAIYVAQQGSPVVEQEEKKLPPQTPIIAAPAEYNSTGTLEISGFTRANTQVTLMVNEQERAITESDADGEFSFSISLPDDAYEIYLFATGDDKNTSPDSQRYSITVDRVSPTLQVTEPQDGAVFTLRREQNTTVRGTLSEVGFVVVNSTRVRTNADGEFQAQIQLGEGENRLEFTGEDLAGNQSEPVVRTVRYQP